MGLNNNFPDKNNLLLDKHLIALVDKFNEILEDKADMAIFKDVLGDCFIELQKDYFIHPKYYPYG